MKGTLDPSSASLIAALAAGITLVALGNGKVGWWLVLSSVIGSAMVAVAVIRGQQSLARVTEVRGDVAVPSGVSSRGMISAGGPDATVPRGRWAGSASVPGSMGYVEIDIFLPVAEALDFRTFVVTRQSLRT